MRVGILAAARRSRCRRGDGGMLAEMVRDNIGPIVILAFLLYVGIGVLGRLMPQLPVFFFGLPLQISIQIWVMALALSPVFEYATAR